MLTLVGMVYRGSQEAAHGGIVTEWAPCPCYHCSRHTSGRYAATLYLNNETLTVQHARRESFRQD